MTVYNYKTVILVLLALIMTPSSYAIILDKEQIQKADISSLRDDTDTLQSIGIGIALSLAKCDEDDICLLNVDVAEMEELIKTVDTRIDTLALKQKEVEDQAAFQEVLAAYEGIRSNYEKQLDKLIQIKDSFDSDDSFLDNALSEYGPKVEAAKDTALLEELELFDGDEKLENDETEWSLPPLPAE